MHCYYFTCFLIFVFYFKQTYSLKYECEGSKTIQYKTGQVVNFESFGYPKNMIENCEFTFVVQGIRNSSNFNNMLVIAMGNFERIEITYDIPNTG